MSIKPIASGEYSAPGVAARLAEMDESLRFAGVVHFNARELCLLRKAKPLGKFYAIPPRTMWPKIIATLMRIAEPLREAYGGPLVVKSGWRPADYNGAVGGAPGSRHVRFEAIDLTCDDVDRLRNLAADLWVRTPDEPFGLGLYAGNIHVDFGYRRRVWGSRKAEVVDARARLEETQAADTVPLGNVEDVS